jgi:hypothetical protein
MHFPLLRAENQMRGASYRNCFQCAEELRRLLQTLAFPLRVRERKLIEAASGGTGRLKCADQTGSGDPATRSRVDSNY